MSSKRRAEDAAEREKWGWEYGQGRSWVQASSRRMAGEVERMSKTGYREGV